jgi:peptide/nickel transport system ATP-binding protein
VGRELDRGAVTVEPGPSLAWDATSGAPLLEVRDLSVRFGLPAGPLVAVEGVSYQLQAGRTLGVVGESGSGKSVTALALLRLLPPTATVTAGQVLWQGRDLLRLAPAALRAIRGRHLSLVFQDPMGALNPGMTIGAQVAESLTLHQDLSRRAARDGAIDWLSRVGLPDPARQAARYPHELSGGMRQRTTIAIALACRPEILIADEPTTALDVTVQARILDLLLDLQAELGLALQFISHNLAVISEIADDIAVMYAGTLVELGPAEHVLGDPRHPYTRALLAAVPRSGTRLPPEPIPGVVPGIGARAHGCLYADRCPLAIAACRADRPALDDLGDGHRVACIRAAEPT